MAIENIMRVRRISAMSVTMAIGAMISFVPTASAQDAASEKAKIEAGENVYNNYCQNCHGDRLANTGQTFDLRRLTAGDRARFDTSVRNGRNQMPPWKDVLSDEEIDQVWHYIRANAYQK
jgi:mono/diheme cytochrome c family protein